MTNDITIHIRDGLVAVVRDAAGNPLDVTVRDYDVDHIPEDELLTDEEGNTYVEYAA